MLCVISPLVRSCRRRQKLGNALWKEAITFMLSNKLAKQLRMGSEVIMEFLRKLCEGAQQKRIRGRLRVWATGLAKARKTYTRVFMRKDVRRS